MPIAATEDHEQELGGDWGSKEALGGELSQEVVPREGPGDGGALCGGIGGIPPPLVFDGIPLILLADDGDTLRSAGFEVVDGDSQEAASGFQGRTLMVIRSVHLVMTLAMSNPPLP